MPDKNSKSARRWKIPVGLGVISEAWQACLADKNRVIGLAGEFPPDEQRYIPQ